MIIPSEALICKEFFGDTVPMPVLLSMYKCPKDPDEVTEPLISPWTSKLELAVILPLALIWPAANILNLSAPAVKNISSSLSAPADVSAVINVSLSISVIPPKVPQLFPSYPS